MRLLVHRSTFFAATLLALAGTSATAQLNDITQTPNTVNAGIKKSLEQQIGAGRGDVDTADSSLFIIKRDPFRSIVRGRQLFQRKFTVAQGLGPRTGDGVGDIEQDGSLGAGLSDSCAGCHSRPLGSAGFGGNVFTRPESRDAPHLFGLGLQEMLADEITTDLREVREMALDEARRQGHPVEADLDSKGIHYGRIIAFPDGSVDTRDIEGVDSDLRVRPFFAQGATISIREFLVGALNAEMGCEAPDADLLAASRGRDVVTPSGMRLTGSEDAIEGPPAEDRDDDPDQDGVRNEVPMALVDHLEFYLLNYFKPGQGPPSRAAQRGRDTFVHIGCADCHLPDLLIREDRRVADVETTYSRKRSNGVFNDLYAEAIALFEEVDDGTGFPPLRVPLGGEFLVENIFTDFKRHDLGPNFHERNFDGTLQTEFVTEPLWGVASTAPYGHDGRSGTLDEVIRRHGGEAIHQRDRYVDLPRRKQRDLLAFLGRMVLFAPPDTSSNLDPADRDHDEFPIKAHGSIDLSPLFLVPGDKE